jgi:excisionase family DNA binding protein
MGAPQPVRDVGEPMLLTYKEACQKIGISMSKLYREMRDGRIHNVKLGPQERRIPMSECEAYVRALVAEQIGSEPGAAA